MAQKLKFGNGTWATKEGSTLAYNDENNNYKPLPFTTTRNSIGTRVNKEGLIEVVGNDIPRIDYTDDSKGALLLEPQRTNSFPYSSDFTSFASASNGTGTNPVITSNYSVSPDGTQNADRIQFNRGSGTSSSDTSYVTYGLSLGTIDATLSIYLKTNDGTTKDVTLRLGASLFDYDVTITSNWQRFTLSGNTSVDRLQILLYGNQNSQTADISCFGAQVEAGSYPTSYIPTQGSAVTRLADSCSQTVPDGVIGQTEGTMYAEIDFKSKPEAGSPIVSIMTLNNNVNNLQNCIILGIERQSEGVNRFYPFVQVSNSTVANVIGGTLTDGIYKVAFAYKQNDFVLYVNGVQIGTDTNGVVPTTSQVLVGERYNTDTYKIADGIKETKLYNTRLSNSELAALTS